MLQPDTLLQNRYRIVSHLGQGGMGAVYVATDERFGSTVALKETFFRDATMLRAFEREARLLNRLRHPALPRVSDHFAEGDGQFLVMEFIAGEDLSAMLARRSAPFPVKDVLTWADELLDALDYLHAQEPPVVHRDIKPQNLKLTPRGQIILLDFGLAKGAPSQASQPTASVYGYSRNYAPIEQIQGTGTDTRSDFYSLGATLYHLMTAAPPADAITRAMAVLNAHDDPLRPANEVNPQVPPTVADALSRAMQQTAAARPQTAAEMRDELRRAAAGLDAAPLANGIAGAATVIADEAHTGNVNPLPATANVLPATANGSSATANVSPPTANVSPATVPTSLASEQATRLIGADASLSQPTVRASSATPTGSRGETTVVAAAPRRSRARLFAAASIVAVLCAALVAFAYMFMRQPRAGAVQSAPPAAAPATQTSGETTSQTNDAHSPTGAQQSSPMGAQGPSVVEGADRSSASSNGTAIANGETTKTPTRPSEPLAVAPKGERRVEGEPPSRRADENRVGQPPNASPGAGANPAPRADVPDDDELAAPNVPPPGVRLPPNVDWAGMKPAQRKRLIRLMRRQIQQQMRGEYGDPSQPPPPQERPFPRRRRQPPP